ncbi:hypothetical protein BDY24DRAFT_285310 [Mrakia frigida]|uniref:uncharacterized protein n=1 Tax=Mrakia frigida TaxID=29902 RepID=UPI003FCBF7AA
MDSDDDNGPRDHHRTSQDDNTGLEILAFIQSKGWNPVRFFSWWLSSSNTEIATPLAQYLILNENGARARRLESSLDLSGRWRRHGEFGGDSGRTRSGSRGFAVRGSSADGRVECTSSARLERMSCRRRGSGKEEVVWEVRRERDWEGRVEFSDR